MSCPKKFWFITLPSKKEQVEPCKNIYPHIIFSGNDKK